jgi:hypothetical protein
LIVPQSEGSLLTACNLTAEADSSATRRLPRPRAPSEKALDYAEQSSSLVGLGHDHLDRIRSRAENPAHLRKRFDRVQDVDRVIAFAKEHDELMPKPISIGFF